MEGEVVHSLLPSGFTRAVWCEWGVVEVGAAGPKLRARWQQERWIMQGRGRGIGRG